MRGSRATSKVGGNVSTKATFFFPSHGREPAHVGDVHPAAGKDELQCRFVQVASLLSLRGQVAGGS